MSLLDRLKRLINSPLAVDHKSCEDCFYEKIKSGSIEYWHFCDNCLGHKDKPFFKPKGDSQ